MSSPITVPGSNPIPVKDWTRADHERLRLALAEHDADDSEPEDAEECGQFFDGQ